MFLLAGRAARGVRGMPEQEQVLRATTSMKQRKEIILSGVDSPEHTSGVCVCVSLTALSV